MIDAHPTAIIAEGAELGAGVEVGPYCVVGPHVKLGGGTRLMSHVVIDGHTTLGAECQVFPFASLGTQTQDLKYQGAQSFVEIGDRTTIREYVTINSGTLKDEVTRVGSGCLIMAYAHVGHGCTVCNGVIMANGVQLAGHVTLEDDCILGGLSACHQFTRVGRLCMVGGATRIVKDCPPFTMIVGNPATAHGLNSVGLKRHNIDPVAQKQLKSAYRILYREGLSTRNALEKIRAELQMVPELEQLVTFVEKAERGIIG